MTQFRTLFPVQFCHVRVVVTSVIAGDQREARTLRALYRLGRRLRLRVRSAGLRAHRGRRGSDSSRSRGVPGCRVRDSPLRPRRRPRAEGSGAREGLPILRGQAAGDTAEARWRRFRYGLLHPSLRHTTPEPAKTPGCRTCGQPKTTDEILARADELGPTDEGLRELVEASLEFESLATRLADTEPADTWKAGMRHHSVYRLRPETDGEGATALFGADWEHDAPFSAIVVVPDPAGGERRVTNIRAEHAAAEAPALRLDG